MTKTKNNFCVYKHTTPSGKVYIGITCQKVEKRWKNGKGYDMCTAFNRAIRKYGWKNIEHEIIYKGLDKETACELECRLIAEYDSTNPKHGYNLTSGGEHYEPSEEMLKRFSESHIKSYKEHPEYGQHLSKIQKGKKMSAESSEKKRQAMLLFYEQNPEKRALCGNSFRGKKRGVEFSEKLGERKSKRVMCIETQKIYDSIKQAAEHEGGSPIGITAMLHGRAKTCKGKTYKFV